MRQGCVGDRFGFSVELSATQTGRRSFNHLISIEHSRNRKPKIILARGAIKRNSVEALELKTLCTLS